MPKRANREGSVRQRPDGRWEARIVVGTDPATGRPKRRSIYGSSQAEVRKQLTKLTKALDEGTYTEVNKLTVCQWLDEWLSTFCHNLKPLTKASYSVIIEKHLKTRLGGIKLQDLRAVHIQGLYNSLIDEGYSPKTVANINGVLSKALSDAFRQMLIPFNPCDHCTLPKKVKKEIKPLTDGEIPLFLDAIKGDPLENALGLALFAGLREGELLGLSWKNVDFENRKLHICQQLQKEKTKNAKYYILPTTKSGSDRVIQPPDIAFEYLHAEKIRQLENRFAAGGAWSNPDDLVFTNPLGEHIAFITLWKHFKVAAEKIGRPDARPHDLRHTCATICLASGADVKSTQTLLGHSSPSFTLSVYAHTSQTMQEDTARRMQSYFDSLQKKA